MVCLTLKPSLRTAETCDLAEHRFMRLQGEARICDKRTLSQLPHGILSSHSRNVLFLP
jgi:hypothetical protein